MELIIICLWDVQKCSKNTTINLFEGEIWDTLLPYFGLRLKSLFSEKKLPLFNSQQFLLPQLPSCDIKTNENLTGFGFSERCWKIATSKLYKTRSEQKCIFDGVKFISVTILNHGLTTKQQTRFGKTEIIWTSSTTINYHHLF